MFTTLTLVPSPAPVRTFPGRKIDVFAGILWFSVPNKKRLLLLGKTWYSGAKSFKVPQSKHRGHGHTLFGAISSNTNQAVYHLGKSTNITDFRKFAESIVERQHPR